MAVNNGVIVFLCGVQRMTEILIWYTYESYVWLGFCSIKGAGILVNGIILEETILGAGGLCRAWLGKTVRRIVSMDFFIDNG